VAALAHREGSGKPLSAACAAEPPAAAGGRCPRIARFSYLALGNPALGLPAGHPSLRSVRPFLGLAHNLAMSTWAGYDLCKLISRPTRCRLPPEDQEGGRAASPSLPSPRHLMAVTPRARNRTRRASRGRPAGGAQPRLQPLTRTQPLHSRPVCRGARNAQGSAPRPASRRPPAALARPCAPRPRRRRAKGDGRLRRELRDPGSTRTTTATTRLKEESARSSARARGVASRRRARPAQTRLPAPAQRWRQPRPDQPLPAAELASASGLHACQALQPTDREVYEC
jgi:hypothetical protein